jgi:hypothetical protein
MTLTESLMPELLPALRALSRADKLHLLQHLVVELAREEGVPLVEMGAAYPVWTPLHAFEAASVMLKALEGAGAVP